MAYDGSQAEAEQPDQRDTGAGQHHRPQHARLAESGPRDVARQRGPSGGEGQERRDLGDREGHGPEDAALAASSSGRFGTAARVARTIPEEYSPVMVRTPSAPISSRPGATPARRLLVTSRDASLLFAP